MKNLLQKLIDDKGGLNSLGRIVVNLFSWFPVVVIIVGMEMGWKINPILGKVLWGWLLLSILFVRLFLYSDQKPFARWSKSRERENLQSTTSVSDSTIRDTTNKED